MLFLGQDILLYSNILLWVFQVFMVFLIILIFRQFGTVYLAKSDAIERDGIPIGNFMGKLEGLSYFSNELITNETFMGKPTLLGFISPGCAPCKELIPEWNRAYQKYNNEINFVLIGVGDKESFSKVKEIKKLKGELLLDPDRNNLQKCKVRVTPFAFILDNEGEVKGKGLCNDMGHINGLISSLKSNVEIIENIGEVAH